MKKITTVVLIIASLLTISCATLRKDNKVMSTPCPKVLLPPVPQGEQMPEPTTLIPGKSYLPKRVEVVTSRSNWSILELYFKSLEAWIKSAQEQVDSHNKVVDENIKKIKEENTKKGWFN